MPGRKYNVRRQRTTLLLVGEGDTEVAFLKFLKSLYCQQRQGPHVAIANAHGKNPQNVLDVTCGRLHQGGFDHAASILDTDIPWPPALRRQAAAANIMLIGNSPCIEGTFLTMLDCSVPGASSRCKTQMNQRLPGTSLLDARQYQDWCTRTMLEDAAQNLPDLQRLLGLYQLP